MASATVDRPAFDMPGGEGARVRKSRPIDFEQLARQTMGDRALEQEVLALFVHQATNIGEQRLPFLWSACLVMPLDGTTRLKLPDAARLRVQSVTGADGAAVLGGTHQWPRLTLEGRSRDLATPWELPRRASVQAWVDLGRARSQVQVRQGAQALTIGVDGAGGLHCGLLLDRGAARSGVRGGLLSRRVPALVLQPSLGAPDRLADALGDWQAVAWLTPGEVRQWSLTLKVGSGP